MTSSWASSAGVFSIARLIGAPVGSVAIEPATEPATALELSVVSGFFLQVGAVGRGRTTGGRWKDEREERELN